jgi:hypothetical protein
MIARYSPAWMLFAASIAHFSEEPHTLLMEVAGIEEGNPAPSAT